jgi:hypothetical protein
VFAIRDGRARQVFVDLGEASWFNGREPDEDRYNLDLRTPDSFAARLTVNPTADTSAQISWARLDSPEGLEPDVSVQRLTASVMWNQSGRARNLALVGVIGHNAPSMGPSTTASSRSTGRARRGAAWCLSGCGLQRCRSTAR